MTNIKFIKIFFVCLAMIFTVFTGILTLTSPAYAQPAKDAVCAGIGVTGADCNDQTGSGNSINNIIAAVINILSIVVGVVAVIFIIVGGFKYITSNGDSNQQASARTTIIYAIVGLVIVVLAQVIVQFVLNRVTE